MTRIDGKIAYVEEEGFETPVLANEVVVVMPAGHEPEVKGAKVMFDQKAYDTGRKTEPQEEVKVAVPEPELPVEETEYGDRMSLTLAFEPDNVKNLSNARFNAVLVNDSNYFLDFTFLRRGEDERGWVVEFRGTVAPNELIDLACYTHETLGCIEQVAIQGVPYKRDKVFTMKSPVNVKRRLDLTKFHKMHCFRPGTYFDNEVLEFPLMSSDLVTAVPEEPLMGEVLSQKYKVEKGKGREKGKVEKRSGKEGDNPHRLLPPVEVDLHAGELLDTTAGLTASDILGYQLETVRKTMEKHLRRKGQKIIFIHGKGEGVLRKSVIDMLKRQYPKAELQDASFREYGFGATLVTIH